MSYQQGNFLYHQEWGTGRVQHVFNGEKGDIVVDFANKKNFVISCSSARKYCHELDPNGFRAYQYKNPQIAETELENNPVDAVKKALRDFPGYCAKTDLLNDYFRPYIKDWKSWWKNTQVLLKKDPYIDSSKSKEKEYRLRERSVSRSRELLDKFINVRRTKNPEETFDTAKKVVLSYIENRGLTDSELYEVVSFLRILSQLRTTDLNLQLDAVFRLDDLKLSTEEEINLVVNKFLDSDRKLSSLDIYVQNKLIKALINTNPKKEKIITAIIDGINGTPAVCENSGEWLIKQMHWEWMVRAIILAFSENIPDRPEKSQMNTLETKLNWIRKLVLDLPRNIPEWSKVVNAFNDYIMRLNQKPEVYLSEFFPFKGLVNIFTDLIERTIKIDKALFKNLVLNFTDLNKPTNWHVRVIETLPDKFLESNSGKEIRQIVSSQKFNERNYKQLALWFSGAQIEDCSSGSKIIREIVEEFPVQSMIEWGSKRLVEICNDLKNSNEFIKLLPALDFFCNINTAPANINQIKEFRTMAYANVYERIFIDNEKPEGYSNIIDTDIIEIVNHVIYEKTRTNEEIIESYREKINSLENELLYIETQLKERSEAFGELSGGAGMNEKNLRYEERFKILKEFAGALSEIERFIINKNIESDEIKGILLRFENILKNFGVNKKGIINEKIIFDPKYCHIAEGEVPDRPAEVDVISTGYIIEGPEKDARVLIPAIVRN